MKKLPLFALMLSLCSFLEAQSQGQTSSRKLPKFLSHSKRAEFPTPPHTWFKKIQGTGLAPNDPFDRLYPPHKRPLAQMPTPLKIGAPQTLSGSAPEAWVARYAGLSSSNDVARAMVVDAAGNVYVTGYSESPEGTDVLTVKYNAAGIQQWTAKYNGPGNVYDEATALCIDAAGNIYVTGHSSRAFYDDYTLSDYVTLKYNSSGVQQWVEAYSGLGNQHDEAEVIAVDGAGNVYVTGYSWNGTNDDYATIKYNAAGTQQWVATYNRPGYGYDHPVDLGIDAAGNVYVTGRSWIGNDDYATVKYNPNGTQEWAAVYNSPENWNDYAVDLAVDDVGNVYVTGSSQKAYSSFDSSSNYVTIKYNTAGTLKWIKTYNGPGNGNDVASTLAVDSKGNVYVTGYSNGSVVGADYATIKYDSIGTQQWVATVGSGKGEDDYPVALAVDGASNVYVTGVRGENFYTVKYNSAGTKKWAATYNGPEKLADNPVALGLDPASGDIYVVGSSYGLGTYSDYATVKYNALGAEKWVARHDEPSPAHDMATAMVVDDAGNIYVTGSSGTVGSSQDYLTIKYNAAGVQQWAAKYNGPGNGEDWAQALTVDAAGNVYVTGYSWNNLTLNDYATIKYNATGIQQWVATYDGLATTKNYSNDHAAALGIDAAGNVYVTGYQWHGYSSSYEDFGYTTVKYNSSGTQEWVAGGGEAIVVDDVGNVYVTGSTLNANDSEEYDYFTAKYNSSGKLQWGRRYNSLYNDDEAVALAVDAAGDVYVTGISGGHYYSEYATVKYNTTGIQQWVAHYKRLEYGDEYPHAIAVDDAGNIYVTGSSGTVKYNSAGKQQWVGDSPGSALALDGAGNVYSTGSNESNFVTIRYNSAGAPQWIANYNGPGNSSDYPVALAVDHTGNIYVAGSSVGLGTGYDFATTKYLPSPLVDAGPDKEICAGGSIQIGGNPTGSGGHGGPYTFSWSPATGLNDPTVSNPIAAPLTTTTYTVIVTEIATGRSAIDEIIVTVRTAGWSVAHIVDIDDEIFGIYQGVMTRAAPRDHRGLALSPNKRFLYLGYNAPYNNRIVRKIDLSVSDPADNHHSVVAQLKLPQGTQPARDIATDDKGRVYLALGTKIEVYRSNLQAPPLHSISGFTACEGVTTRRENGTLVVYATDRVDKTLKLFVLVEGTGEAITSSNKTGLDGDGEVLIKDTINNRNAVSPRGLEVQSNGTIWVADVGANQVFRFHTDGSAMASIGANRAMDVAIDESRGEVYISQYTLRRIKVCNLNGAHRRFMTPAITNIDLDGEDGMGALCGIDVASCQRVFVANEKGRSILTNGDSPFSNVGDNNDVKAADTDPVLVLTGNVLAKESEVEESEVTSHQQPVTSYELAQNYPNPVLQIPRVAGNPSTTIRFALPEAAEVSLKIYDVAGQLVQTLVDGVVQAGRHQVVWDGTNMNGVQVASGIYFYQLRAGEFKQVRKMSLVR